MYPSPGEGGLVGATCTDTEGAYDPTRPRFSGSGVGWHPTVIKEAATTSTVSGWSDSDLIIHLHHRIVAEEEPPSQ